MRARSSRDRGSGSSSGVAGAVSTWQVDLRKALPAHGIEPIQRRQRRHSPAAGGSVAARCRRVAANSLGIAHHQFIGHAARRAGKAQAAAIRDLLRGLELRGLDPGCHATPAGTARASRKS
jgi:hypothetical protein